MTFALALDLALLALLTGTLAAGVVLERRLAALRRDRERLAAAATSVIEALEQARETLDSVSTTVREDAPRLEEMNGRASSQIDDLRYLVDRAEGLADRLARVPAASAGLQPGRAGGSGAPRIAVASKPKVSARADHTSPVDGGAGVAVAVATKGASGRPAPAAWDELR